MVNIAYTSPNDLAFHHRPITDMFERPMSPEAWEPYALSEAQIQSYVENGFVSGIQIMTEKQVDQFHKELEQLFDPDPEQRALFYLYESNESEDPTKVLFHALGAWRVLPAFHDILWAPAFRMATWQLMGIPFRHFHDQLFCKPAQHGGVVAWHQDFSYWTWTKPNTHLSCWIALDDVSEENGCVYFVPGSHKWELLPITGLTGDMEAVEQVLNGEQKEAFENKVPNILKKGYASFHSSMTMHGSYENLSDYQRRAMVLNVMGDGTLSNIDSIERGKDVDSFPMFPQDAPMTGTYYPILFDPEKELGKRQHAFPNIRDFM